MIFIKTTFKVFIIIIIIIAYELVIHTKNFKNNRYDNLSSNIEMLVTREILRRLARENNIARTLRVRDVGKKMSTIRIKK